MFNSCPKVNASPTPPASSHAASTIFGHHYGPALAGELIASGSNSALALSFAPSANPMSDTTVPGNSGRKRRVLRDAPMTASGRSALLTSVQNLIKAEAEAMRGVAHAQNEHEVRAA